MHGQVAGTAWHPATAGAIIDAGYDSMTEPRTLATSRRPEAAPAVGGRTVSGARLATRTLGALGAAAFFAACMASSTNTMQGSAGSTASVATAGTPRLLAATDSAAGQYLTIVGGCNDCHTPGWAESNGKTPPAEQLTGSPVGYRGPWGTSYAANLRTVAQRATEDRWVQILTTADGGHGRPPMPWMNTAQMSDHDLRAVYRYIRSLGPAGKPAPRAVPPGGTPTTPYINFVPVTPGSGS